MFWHDSYDDFDCNYADYDSVSRIVIVVNSTTFVFCKCLSGSCESISVDEAPVINQFFSFKETPDFVLIDNDLDQGIISIAYRNVAHLSSIRDIDMIHLSSDFYKNNNLPVGKEIHYSTNIVEDNSILNRFPEKTLSCLPLNGEFFESPKHLDKIYNPHYDFEAPTSSVERFKECIEKALRFPDQDFTYHEE